MERRDAALKLAGELLTDIELSRIKPIDIARKASRLARLTEDIEAMRWLYYEITGFPEGVKGLDADAWAAAVRSNRTYSKEVDNEMKQFARTGGLGWLQASIDSAEKQLAVSGGGNYIERGNLRNEMVTNQAILDKIVGSIHAYANSKYQELRFGAAVSTAFDELRTRIDSQINSLIPEALPILSTALENSNSENPLHWRSAAQACRDLIKATADALRPPGEAVRGREMTDSQYINRLMDWIEARSKSKTLAKLVTADLDYLGRRLDAVTGSGNRGAHAKVRKEDAARYIVGTYVFLGDILSLGQRDQSLDEPVQSSQKANTKEQNISKKTNSKGSTKNAKRKPEKK